MADIIQFRPRPAAVGYAPGVPPFDASNPAHIEAWNWAFAFAASEARFEEKALRERRDSIFFVDRTEGSQ